MKTLLRSVLKQNPQLIPVVFPTQWSARYSTKLGGSSAVCWQYSYDRPLTYALILQQRQAFLQRGGRSLSELETSFEKLLQQDQITFKLCLFISGLDEYEGDENEIAELFGEISRLPHVKSCVSSRPHLVFHDAFEGHPGLRLEDFTYPDIERDVTDKF